MKEPRRRAGTASDMMACPGMNRPLANVKKNPASMSEPQTGRRPELAIARVVRLAATMSSANIRSRPWRSANRPNSGAVQRRTHAADQVDQEQFILRQTGIGDEVGCQQRDDGKMAHDQRAHEEQGASGIRVAQQVQRRSENRDGPSHPDDRAPAAAVTNTSTQTGTAMPATRKNGISQRNFWARNSPNGTPKAAAVAKAAMMMPMPEARRCGGTMSPDDRHQRRAGNAAERATNRAREEQRAGSVGERTRQRAQEKSRIRDEQRLAPVVPIHERRGQEADHARR